MKQRSLQLVLLALCFALGLGLRMKVPGSRGDPSQQERRDSEVLREGAAAAQRPSLAAIAAASGRERLRLELEFLDQASAAEVAALVDERVGGGVALGWEPAFRRWFEVDAVAALDFARVGEDELRSPIDDRLIAGYAAFLEVDEEAAISAALEDPAELELVVVIDLLATLDPARGSQLLVAGSAALRQRFFDRLGEYFVHGGAGDLEALAKLGVGEDQLLAALVSVDPTAALAQARGRSGLMARSQGIALVLGAVAERDSQLALAMLGSIDSAYERSLGAGAIAAQMAVKDRHALDKWLAALPRRMVKETAVSRATVAILLRDPGEALEFLSRYAGDLHGYSNPANVEKDGMVPVPDSMSVSPYSYPAGTELLDLFDQESFREYCESQPIEALRSMRRLPPVLRSTNRLRDAIELACRERPAVMRAWLDELPAEGRLREEFEGLYSAITKEDE